MSEPPGTHGEINVEGLRCEGEGADHTPMLDDVATTKLTEMREGDEDRTK